MTMRDFLCLDLAVCVGLTGALPKKYGYDEYTLAFSGDTASLICKSDELDDGLRALLTHLDENRYQTTSAMYEIRYEDGTVELKLPVAGRVRCQDAPLADGAFANDPDAVGKWQLIDIVNSREQFVYGAPCDGAVRICFCSP